MKKILFLLAAVSLTMTSCLKEDESYKQYLLIAPGANIYDGARKQQLISSQPLDQVMRLGILLSEAAVQNKEIEDLPTMTVTAEDATKINVFDALFRKKTTIAKTAEGNYTIDLKPEGSGYFTGEGVITVNTNGVPLLQDTDQDHPWMVTLPSDYNVRISSRNSATGYQDISLEGSVMVYKNGTYYSLQVMNMKAYVKESSTIASNWNGFFELTPPVGGESLAFSTCRTKLFRLEGQAYGPTCITYNYTTGAQMSYSIAEGVFADFGLCVDGTETAKFTSFGDYDPALYPSPEVKMIWKLSADGKSYSQTINYNGSTMTF